MPFSYNAGIPQGSNDPGVDQPQMLQNFSSISSLILQDHFGFNSTNGGTHKQVTLTNESAPGIGPGNGVLYANLGSDSNSWPFWQNNAAGSPFQLIGQASTIGLQGNTILWNGVEFKWGFVPTVVGLNTVTFPVAFANNCFTVQLTLILKNGNISPSGNGTLSITNSSPANPLPLKTGFKYYFNGSINDYTNAYYFAIGN